MARSGPDHESIRDKQDEPVIARMRELAAQYPRYGYRRIRIFMERDGFKISVDRAHRPASVACSSASRSSTRDDDHAADDPDCLTQQLYALEVDPPPDGVTIKRTLSLEVRDSGPVINRAARLRQAAIEHRYAD